MRKLTKMGLECINKWAGKAAKESVSSMSLYLYYEPKMPKELLTSVSEKKK
ncbi:cyclic lactone autoinducer peptide [Irregularibacter muris]|uniref:Cyclic lactone autoinducer peptide n=1 Tax=Irregularibacter muris TaxID=1796619 RepID=A0AAE3KYF5_9FIRM|nr:cyclic lactone autoinducer peptide [Irregularibacter muris]MCR1897390.1 cyclic lactone autoinducer peptide [Irregularibacter muris]